MPPTNRLGQGLARLDAWNQSLFKKHLDSWLRNPALDGQLRSLRLRTHSQSSPTEVAANRDMALSGLAAVGLLAARTVSLAFLPLVVCVGIYLTYPLIKKCYHIAVRERRLSFFHVFGIYSVTMWAGGHFLAGILGSFVFALNRKVMALCEDRSKSNVALLFAKKPQSVWIRRSEQDVKIPFDQLSSGDVMVVHAGQVVPADGSVIRGEGWVNQSLLTGESQPVQLRTGDSALATTLLVSGLLHIRTESTGSDTVSGNIVRLLDSTQGDQEALERKAYRQADRYTLPSIGVSSLCLVALGLPQAALILGSNMTMFMLMLAPYTLLRGINQLSNQTVLIKDGKALLALGKIDTIVFDKTGTLTDAVPSVIKIHPCADLDAREVLRLAAAAEQRQSHPIAKAVTNNAETQDLNIPQVDNVVHETGAGISAHIEAGWIKVGSPRSFSEAGIRIPPDLEELLQRCARKHHTAVMVGFNQEIVGVIELAIHARQEVLRTVQQLREQVSKIQLISGDREAPTQNLAEELKINEWHANILPQDKAALVLELQNAGHKVAFVGDGINDTLAMRQADVSISLAGASTAATDTAQVVLMDGSIKKLPQLFRVAQSFQLQLTRNQTMLGVMTGIAITGVILFNGGFLFVELLAGLSLAAGLRIATQSHELPTRSMKSVGVRNQPRFKKRPLISAPISESKKASGPKNRSFSDRSNE